MRAAGQRVEARAVLREALDLATRVRHAARRPVAGRARRRRDAPRRDRRLLTASEDRVAALAAGGLSNREVPRRPTSPVTAVEFHLGNVYRKRGISTRAELPAALAADG